MVIILSLSLWPASRIPRVKWPYIDKAVHILLYGGLTIAMLYGFSAQYDFFKRRYKYALMALLASAFYGTIMEVMQYMLTKGRNFESQDILANIIGSLLASLIFVKLFKQTNDG